MTDSPSDILLWKHFTTTAGKSGWVLVNRYPTKEQAADSALFMARGKPELVLVLTRPGPDGEIIEPPPLVVIQQAILPAMEQHLERCLQASPSDPA